MVDEASEDVLEERVGGEYVTFRVYVFLLPSGILEVDIFLSAIGFTTSLVDTVLFLRLIR